MTSIASFFASLTTFSMSLSDISCRFEVVVVFMSLFFVCINWESSPPINGHLGKKMSSWCWGRCWTLGSTTFLHKTSTVLLRITSPAPGGSTRLKPQSVAALVHWAAIAMFHLAAIGFAFCVCACFCMCRCMCCAEFITTFNWQTSLGS